jgi:hypothetical protein
MEGRTNHIAAVYQSLKTIQFETKRAEAKEAHTKATKFRFSMNGSLKKTARLSNFVVEKRQAIVGFYFHSEFY